MSHHQFAQRDDKPRLISVADKFKYHEVSVGQTNKMAEVRVSASHLLEVVENYAPAGREQSLAITKLEEAVFWANKAIAKG